MNAKLCAVIACLFVATPAFGQAPPAWKFAKGQLFDAERTVTQKQTVTFNGKDVKKERSSVWQIRLEVKDPQADGFLVLATINKVEHKLTGATKAEILDVKLHEKMQGSVFRLKVTPSGRLTQMEGYEDFLKRLAGQDAEQLKAVRATLPEASIKEALADLFGPLPEKQRSWQRDYVEPLPHFGSLRSIAKYEHVGVKKGLERIDYRVETKYEAPKEKAMPLFRIEKGAIDADEAAGSIAFDLSAGHLVEHTRTMKLRGNFTIEMMDRQYPLDFRSDYAMQIHVKAAK